MLKYHKYKKQKLMEKIIDKHNISLPSLKPHTQEHVPDISFMINFKKQ